MSSARTVNDLMNATEPIINLLPDGLEEVTRLDAQYHAGVKNEWTELSQLDAERNKRFHNQALTALKSNIGPNAVILELGSGVGHDAGSFLLSGASFGCYIVSEISPRLLEHSKRQLASVSAGRSVVYCCVDANNILIADSQVDAILAVAAVHHFPNVGKALAEIDRVTRPGATIVFAMEPNRLWSTILVALRPIYRRFFIHQNHSAADEQAEGFSFRQLQTMGESMDWQLKQLTPVWFFTGFLHIGLEFTYRLLRMRKRIRVPLLLERTCLLVDAALFKLPIFRRLSWHYTAVYQK
jgi:ubiquinone/menaquinone biosynthesis C-methylase UbiE